LIEIVLNGQPAAAPEGESVQALLARLELDAGRVAVEHNRSILKREAWEHTILRAGDAVEIVMFVGGGSGY
jgi:thiamine biosynthesis protein ThiS